MLRLKSRRQLDYDLRDLSTQVLPNVNRLAGTAQDTLPVDGTLEHFLGHVGWSPFADLRTEMIRRLIRMKALDDGRLLGHHVIAIDGTGWLSSNRRHCPACMVQHHEKVDVFLHQVLEAKLVGQVGLALSVETEFVDADPALKAAVDVPSKQDCELIALTRMVPRLKRKFPQLPICLSGDALYACGRVFEMVKQNGWAFVVTFKEGRLPAVWEDFQQLLKASPENRLAAELPGGVRQCFSWVNGLSYKDDDGRTHVFNALQCEETVKGATTRYAWATNLPLDASTVVAIASKGGRSRSRIENEGFNTQKNGDYHLCHAFSANPDTCRAYYLLLQIAHMVSQLFEKGSLLRRIAQKLPAALFGSLRNLARRLLECFRYAFIPDDAFDAGAAAACQIRLDES